LERPLSNATRVSSTGNIGEMFLAYGPGHGCGVDPMAIR
jgi:hypothetical protein